MVLAQPGPLAVRAKQAEQRMTVRTRSAVRRRRYVSPDPVDWSIYTSTNGAMERTHRPVGPMETRRSGAWARVLARLGV